MPMLGTFYVQYPDMTTYDEWSPWYLCEIEVGADGSILQIDLKNTDIRITSTDIKKLRVFDPSSSSESDQRYCLGIHENILYKFSYTKLPGAQQHSCIAGLPLIIKTTRGPITSSGSINNVSTISWTHEGRLRIDKFCKDQADNRLEFNQAEYDFLKSMTIRDMPCEPTVPAVDTLPAGQTDANEIWQRAKLEHTLTSYTEIATNLSEVQQSLIMACPLWNYIRELKTYSRSQKEYCQLLLQAYNRQTVWLLQEAMSKNATRSLELFHQELGERVLRDLDLNLFRDTSQGSQPTRNDVQSYILAVIANEFQSYSTSSILFSGIRLEEYIPQPITAWDQPMQMEAPSQDEAWIYEDLGLDDDDNEEALFSDPYIDGRLAMLQSIKVALATGDPTHPINATGEIVSQEPKDPIQESIDKLNRTISSIDNNTHRAIFENAIAICTNLQSLPRTTRPRKANITRALVLTSELLQSPPGSARTEALRQYKDLARTFTNHYHWNHIGRLMMRMAALFVGLGTVCILASSGGLPVAVTAAGLAFSGGTLPWTFTLASAIPGLIGFGICKARPISPTTDHMQKMAEKIENEPDCVAPGATAG